MTTRRERSDRAHKTSNRSRACDALRSDHRRHRRTGARHLPGGERTARLGHDPARRYTPDVYSVLPGGQAMHRLTDDPAFDACADYSADGTQIAYCSSRGDPTGQFDIWTMKQNGKDKRRLTQLGGGATFPDFSPDGSKIAFGARPAGAANVDVYVMNADGSDVVQLTT